MPVSQMVDSVEDAFDEIGEVNPPLFGGEFDDVSVRQIDTGNSNGNGEGVQNNVNINVYARDGESAREIAKEVERQFVLWQRQRKAAFV